MRGFGRNGCFCLWAILGLCGVVAIPGVAQTTMTMERLIVGDGYYRPGETLDITVTFLVEGSDRVLQLGLEEVLPAGWTFNTLVGGRLPQIPPASGASGQLNFAWITAPNNFPISFTYRVNTPASSTGTKSIIGRGFYGFGTDIYPTLDVISAIPSLGGGEGEGEGAAEGEGEGAVEGEGEGAAEGEGEGAIAETVVSYTRVATGDGSYAPGGTVDLTVTISKTGEKALTQLGISEELPAGWSFNQLVSGALPPIKPNSGSTGSIAFAWISIPALPITFTYRLNVPADTTGTQEVSGEGIYSVGAEQLYTALVLTSLEEGAAAEGEGEGAVEGEGEGGAEGEGEGAAPVEGMTLTRSAGVAGFIRQEGWWM